MICGKGHQLPGTGELAFLLVLRAMGTSVTASEVARQVWRVTPDMPRVSLRSVYNCGERLTLRGWAAREATLINQRERVRYSLTEEGERVMGIILGRIDAVRSIGGSERDTDGRPTRSIYNISRRDRG